MRFVGRSIADYLFNHTAHRLQTRRSIDSQQFPGDELRSAIAGITADPADLLTTTVIPGR
jgi:hypothetical protein